MNAVYVLRYAQHQYLGEQAQCYTKTWLQSPHKLFVVCGTLDLKHVLPSNQPQITLHVYQTTKHRYNNDSRCGMRKRHTHTPPYQAARAKMTQYGRGWGIHDLSQFSHHMDSVYMFSLLEFRTTKPPSLACTQEHCIILLQDAYEHCMP